MVFIHVPIGNLIILIYFFYKIIPEKSLKHIHYVGAGEMVQQLRALVAFLDDLGSIPRNHIGLQLSVTPVLGKQTPTSGL